MFAMDTMTLIGPGTWEAAGAVAEARSPPPTWSPTAHPPHTPSAGHPDTMSGATSTEGSCYLNNAAIAASGCGPASPRCRDHRPRRPPRQRTQEIFYRRPDVVYGSVHVDPGAGWFPHFVGYDEETGEGEGAGANLNLPLPPGTGDAGWLEAVDRLTRFAADRVGAMVVSLGVDARATTPRARCRSRSTAMRRRAGCWRVSACPPSSSRKVGTTWTASASWCWLRCSPSRGRGGTGMTEAGALSSKLVAMWVGKDTHGGVPSQPRPDLPPPPHWRLEAIAATERPHHLALSPDVATVAFALDRDTSDMWSSPSPGGPPDG